MLVGKRIGNFLCTAKVGQGGMGAVFKAVEDITGRNVAIKIMTERGAANPAERTRFERERSAICQISHPGVPPCIGWGEWHGLPWMAMELINGTTLEDLAKEPMPPVRALHLTSLLCSILDACYHLVGMVHRDIKPGNIMVVGDPDQPGVRVRLIDYGIALFQDRPDDDNFNQAYVYTGVHSPKDLAGTPAYMPPEQWLGGDMDCRSDMYAVGVMLFRLITGRLPFEAKNVAAYLIAHRDMQVPDPSTLATIGQASANVIMRCMAKQMQARFKNYQALIQALNAAMHEEQARSRRKTSTVVPHAHAGTGTTSGWRRPTMVGTPGPTTPSTTEMAPKVHPFDALAPQLVPDCATRTFQPGEMEAALRG